MTRRTRIVGLLRVVLPLAALVLLSTLFLFGSRPEPGGLLPYSDVTPDDLARRPVVTQPSYAGVALDGTEIEMKAASANPQDADGRSAMTGVNLTLRGTDGLVADLTAAQAEMHDDVIRLQGDVEVTTSTGWRLRSDAFRADTLAGSLTADQQVEADGPFGEMTAGTMRLQRQSDGSRDHVLDLNGGVRMIYRP